MSECDEVALTLLPAARMLEWPAQSMGMCRTFVTRRMPDESMQVQDNVTEALFDMLHSPPRR